MGKKINILIVDDHPLIIEGYKNTLNNRATDDYDIEIDTAANCEEAVHKINQANSFKIPYDVFFIDINLPASKDGQYTSGEDIARLAQTTFAFAKIVILTMHNEVQRINNILRNVDPDGFLIKNDVTAAEFVHAFHTVLVKPPYYSHSVSQHLRKRIRNDFALDDKNLKILTYLSKGVQTKNITNLVGLSLSAVAKRKTQIKELFGIPNAEDQELLAEARKRGFL
jgi:DNA-binding NarL/FixJ family response regulator